MLEKDHGGLCKAPTKEEGRKQKAKRRDQIKFIDLRFERWQAVSSGKQEEGKIFYKLHVLGMNDDLWDRVFDVGHETWKGCE